ncbi:AlpA family transcriptional regulator [Cellulomonas cellasea]|uniref:Excisionase family DNA binding protein n=1 Tax=Cellulomonas cellasea TaxID=43670 RepID=A0A7W4UCY4_9CELL|nr:helix-turn-helix domain-containing protein [Cellulomonas cellasea]MBB2921243.1 excisionase family DNA binding protein [Cellulomonas cellasea]
MDTDVTSPTQATMTLTELADFLSVTPQALYDLRSKGRGPRGFRVGRLLRFRQAEVEAWIAGMEAADGERHHPRTRT